VAGHIGLVAVLWRGVPGVAATETREYGRLQPVLRALSELGVAVEPVAFDDDRCQQILEQLGRVDGVLVWVDPIGPDADRTVLDGLLREVSSRGAWVSAHPDTIDKMGTKEVLYRTRSMGWGTETHLYATAPEFRDRFPGVLGGSGRRVLKQNRGNGGQGLWKVELSSDFTGETSAVRVLHAQRGSVPEVASLGEFLTRCESYFGWGGCVIDQPFQPRLPDGMIRCYMAGDRVAGFALGMPISSTGRAMLRARTAMCCAKSMSAHASRSRTRHRQ